MNPLTTPVAEVPATMSPELVQKYINRGIGLALWGIPVTQMTRLQLVGMIGMMDELVSEMLAMQVEQGKH